MEIGNFDKLILNGDLEGAEIIPIVATEEIDEKIKNEALPEELAILPLKNMVLFPGLILPISIKRESASQLIKDANNKNIGVVAQKNNNEELSKDDIYNIGTVARIVKVIKFPDGNVTAVIHGIKRF